MVLRKGQLSDFQSVIVIVLMQSDKSAHEIVHKLEEYGLKLVKVWWWTSSLSIFVIVEQQQESKDRADWKNLKEIVEH